MNDDMRRAELDDILFEFVCEVERPDWTIIQAWMDRFPAYAHEIGDFAAAWILSETLPQNPETAAIPEERWHELGLRAYERAVAEERAGYAAAPLTSIVATAQSEGKDLATLAAETRTSETLLLKLERRVIKAADVPQRLIGELAQRLHTSTGALASYLAQPPRLAAGAQYRAEQPPEVQAQESFVDAVKNDRSISQADRERLLAMTRGDGDASA